MGVYRVDVSPNNRAGCQTKHCKDAGVKIMKGEFRYATQVTIKEHQSWQYRHWGCVTPKQIENLLETCGGDTEMVDGFDELPAEFQEKVVFALENGHVQDEDWKGDPELNRPGQTGVKKRTSKKAAEKAADKDAEDDDAADEKPKKKRGRPAKKEVNGEEEEEPIPPTKKRGRPAKKDVEVEENDEEEVAPPIKKARGRAKMVEYKEESDEEAPPPRKARARKAAVKADKAEENGDAEGEVEEEEVPKPKRGKKKANVVDGEDKVPQKKSGRKKAAAAAE